MKLAPLVVLAISAVFLAPVAFAQGQLPPVSVDGPVTHLGTYDLATQSFLATVPSPADGSAVVFDNTAFGGSFFQPGSGSVNMDWGTLSAGGFNDITTIQIGYGTETLGTVDMVVALHAGASGFGSFGTATGYRVALLHGWRGSKGAKAECAAALWAQFPVFELNAGILLPFYEDND
jgi:hypothetical protein